MHRVVVFFAMRLNQLFKTLIQQGSMIDVEPILTCKYNRTFLIQYRENNGYGSWAAHWKRVLG